MKLRSSYFMVYLTALAVFVALVLVSVPESTAGDIREAVRKAEADRSASEA